MTHDSRLKRDSRLGTVAAWLSGASMLVYFLSSYVVRSYFAYFWDKFGKTLEIIFK